jgi:hypothetical protein
MHGNTHVPGGPDPIPITPTGIQFETDPQDGAWLHIETTAIEGGGPFGHGIRLIADLGDLELNAVDHDITLIAGNDILWSSDRDVAATADRDLNLSAQRDIVLDVGTGTIILHGLPTTDPGITGALWNDGGTLKVS